MGGSNFPGTTNVPHMNIIRDNGKAENGQVIYFNPNTLSLDYSHGKEGGDVSDCSIISWKQLHLAALNSVTVTEQDHVQYNHFAKTIWEEIREVALGMIEASYMDSCKMALKSVKHISLMSDFRKLWSSLNAHHVTELLLIMESVTQHLDIGSALQIPLKSTR
jgi:hypothetical protein